MPTPVTVNLAVEIDASGSLTVFGQAPFQPTNVIVANVKLPIRALYDAAGSSNNAFDNSLFEFWEPSDQGLLGTRKATLSGKDASPASNGRDYSLMTKKLVMDLQSILEGSFDCSGATPFNVYKDSNSNYYTPNNFGRLALSVYAHYLFGHVAATAAITNDKTLMNNMLSQDVNNAYKFSSVSSVDLTSNLTGDVSDANLAVRIVDAITKKDDSAILQIVEQVLGQDASRAMGADNNQLAPNVRQALKFIKDDIIYINIRINRPIVNVNGNTNAPSASDILENQLNEINYTLKITLDDIPGAIFPSGNDLRLVTLLGDEETAITVLNNIKDATITEGGSVSVSTIYDLSTVPTADLSTTRSAIISTVLNEGGVTTFTTTQSDLLLNNTQSPQNLLVVSPKLRDPLNVTTVVSQTTAIYANVDTSGQNILLTDGTSVITIYKTGENTYTYNGQTYTTGDTFIYAGRTVIFGSVWVYPTPVPNITYGGNKIFVQGDNVNMTVTNTGGVANSFSISPTTLPAGLSFNTSTGAITGSPTTVTADTQYTVSATNEGGSGSVTFTIRVNSGLPNISYSGNSGGGSFTLVKGTSYSITPTNSGQPVAVYSISPALPTGLSFNTNTGVISGTPTILTAPTSQISFNESTGVISGVEYVSYNITGTNSGGSSSFTAYIKVVDTPPNVSYEATKTFYKDEAGVTYSPTVINGGEVARYQISGGVALPAGLTLNQTTGVISGTPTTLVSNFTATIIAVSTGGVDMNENNVIKINVVVSPFKFIITDATYITNSTEYPFVMFFTMKSKENHNSIRLYNDNDTWWSNPSLIDDLGTNTDVNTFTANQTKRYSIVSYSLPSSFTFRFKNNSNQIVSANFTPTNVTGTLALYPIFISSQGRNASGFNRYNIQNTSTSTISIKLINGIFDPINATYKVDVASGSKTTVSTFILPPSSYNTYTMTSADQALFTYTDPLYAILDGDTTRTILRHPVRGAVIKTMFL
jgi:hypothetical protein